MAPTPEPDLQIAARLLAEGRPGDAVDRLGALVAGAPVYAAAHVLLATALEADGRPAEALASWARAAALVPSSPLVHRERRRLLDAARPAPEPEAAPPNAAPSGEDREPAEAPETAEEPEEAPDRPAPEPVADEVLAAVVADVQAVEVDGAPADEVEADGYGDLPDGPSVGGAERDLRPVDERFLRDDDDFDDEEADDGGTGALGEEPVAADALFDPSDIFEGIADAPHRRDEPTESTDVDVPEGQETAGRPAPDPGGAGGAEADAETTAPSEGAPPRPDALADELDALISRLDGAPPIRPDPAFSGPAVQFDDAGADEMASETLAKIYAAQRQYGRAADVYETLAAREPERADALLRQADEMRQRR